MEPHSEHQAHASQPHIVDLANEALPSINKIEPTTQIDLSNETISSPQNSALNRYSDTDLTAAQLNVDLPVSHTSEAERHEEATKTIGDTGMVKPSSDDSTAFYAASGLPLDQALLETELKFALTERQLKAIDLTETPSSQITQHYLPEAFDTIVAGAILNELGINIHDLPEAPRFTQTRVRKVETRDDTTYYLQAKARFADATQADKVELGIEISKEHYKGLKKVSQDTCSGMVKKRRYSVEGEVHTGEGSKQVTAEIDVVQKAGPTGEPIDTDLRLITADVEASSREELQALRDGNHSFEFLLDAFCLTDADEKIRKGYSTSRLGKRGIVERTEKALEKVYEAEKTEKKKGKKK